MQIAVEQGATLFEFPFRKQKTNALPSCELELKGFCEYFAAPEPSRADSFQHSAVPAQARPNILSNAPLAAPGQARSVNSSVQAKTKRVRAPTSERSSEAERARAVHSERGGARSRCRFEGPSEAERDRSRDFCFPEFAL